MKASQLPFRVHGAAAFAILLVLSIGCMKPSMRDAAVDLNNTSGGSLTIWHDSFETAREQALVSGKPILADFTGSDWCSWCVKLHDDVFSKPEFEAWARENVVLLELDFPQRSSQSSEIKAQNEKLASMYAIEGFPTVLLLDAQGNELARSGYAPDPASFIGNFESQLP